MIPNTPTEVDWLFLFLNVVFGILFLYQGWENIANHRISRFGLDAVAVWLGLKLGTPTTRQRILRTISVRKRLTYAGIYALLLGLVCVYFILYWLRQFSFL